MRGVEAQQQLANCDLAQLHYSTRSHGVQMVRIVGIVEIVGIVGIVEIVEIVKIVEIFEIIETVEVVKINELAQPHFSTMSLILPF